MLNPIIILSLLFIADRRRHRQSSAVGYADSIVPGATTRVFRSAKDAVDFAADADMAGGTFQGEIEIVQDGYSISDDLAELADVSTFETTKGGVLDALRDAPTPAMALNILTHVLVEQNQVDLPDEEFERFENLEFEPLPAPTYLDFNNEEVPF